MRLLLLLTASNHHEGLLAAKKKRELVDHRLDDVLQVGAHGFEPHHVGELDGQQRGPPADRQIFAVHAV